VGRASAVVGALCALILSVIVAPGSSADQGSADGTQPLIAMGYATTCAVRESTLVYCWGDNSSGELGRNSTSPTQTVYPVTQLQGAIAVYGAGRSFCALLSDHTLSCWGSNMHGVLGVGSPAASFALPIPVPLTHVATAALGEIAMCAAKQDGTVWCAGYGSTGITGVLAAPDVDTPQKIAGLSGVTAVAVGTYHACALKVDHTVWCWGDDSYLELGNDSTSHSSATPVKVKGLTDAVAISAGSYHTCAVRSSGAVVCWGNNTGGQLGNPLVTASQSAPTTVYRLSGVKFIAADILSTCAATATETKCWGAGSTYQLGDGGTTGQPAPVLVTATSSKSTGLAMASQTVCQITHDRYVWCWGLNGSGEAGTGSTSDVRYGGGPGSNFGRVDIPNTVPIRNSAPGTPTGSSPSAKKVKVSWAAPSTSNGTSAPKDYYVYYQLKGTSTWKKFADAVSSSRSATVTGLTSGKYYRFKVVPVNWAGAGASSAASAYIKSK
jgi:alpha-tubulin suppressor-like RCC1 family protein